MKPIFSDEKIRLIFAVYKTVMTLLFWQIVFQCQKQAFFR